jgi:hypothetical protein
MGERLWEPLGRALKLLACYLVLLACGWAIDNLLVPAGERA